MRRTTLLAVLGLIALLILLIRAQCTFAKSSVDVVVARYEEPLDWLAHVPLLRDRGVRRIFVYSKGSSAVKIPRTVRHKTTVLTLPNVGREGHTYLVHILRQWHSLPSVTVFTQASCYLWNDRRTKFLETLEGALTTQDSVFLCERPSARLAEPNFLLNAHGPTNEFNAKDSSALQPSPIRPFGAWYDDLFPAVEMKGACLFGIFAVSRDAILQKDAALYRKIVSQLAQHSNPEVGHYLERSWLAVFYPVPDQCITRTFSWYFLDLIRNTENPRALAPTPPTQPRCPGWVTATAR